MIKKKKTYVNKKNKKVILTKKHTDSKKNQKSKLDLKEIKRILEEKKMEIYEDLKLQSQYETISEKDIGDEIDEVVNTIEKELKFDISSNEKNILNEIDIALRKIENGTYGICELCKKQIEVKRLKAIPYSRYCIECQKKQQNF